MIVRGLKRLALIFLALTGVATALSLAVGLATGASALRSLSLGFMLIGTLVFCGGAALSLRGPLRPTHREDGTRSGVQVAPPEDVTDDLHLGRLLIGLGLVLVLIGIAADPRTQMF